MRRRELRLSRARVALAAAGVVVALAVAPSVRAQACAPANLRFALPSNGAVGVPLDATLRAYYAIGARYAAESVIVTSGTRSESFVGDFDRSTGVLSVTPTTVLEPRITYTVTWPALVSSGAPGRGAIVSFTTGEALDGSPPAIDEIARLDWDVIAIDDVCIGTSIERYVFDVALAGARDDGGADTLEASVYLTRGPLLAATLPPRLVATEPPGEAAHAVRVTLPREDSLGQVCFSALVRDLRGRTSAATPERCVVTERPPFFRSCDVTAAGIAASSRSVLGTLLLAVVALRVRRRARR